MKKDVSNGRKSDWIDEVYVLGEYKKKKTPDGRRDCIKRLSAELNIPVSDIAAFLLDYGCQVDGRLVRGATNTKKVSPKPEIPGWDGPQEVKKDDAPVEPPPVADPAPAQEPESPAQGMTAGVLMSLLDGIAPEATVRMNGQLVYGCTITGKFSMDGQRKSCVVDLEGR